MDEKINDLMKIYLPEVIIEDIVLSHSMMVEKDRRLLKSLFDTQEAYRKYRNEVLKNSGKP